MNDSQMLFIIQSHARGMSWRSIATALGKPWTEVRAAYLKWASEADRG